LRRGWTRLWVSASAIVLAGWGTAAQAPEKKRAVEHRNELSLAGLRPGRDTVHRARELYREPDQHQGQDNSEMAWSDACTKQMLTIETDQAHRIQTVRASVSAGRVDHCGAGAVSPWGTGWGLRLGDSANRVIRLYGKPDSRSPSTKDGQKLELLYYAFDWAGPDVPQVMEVLCTVGKDGEPGHVVEITLAASSL
jgi:hypothetical protein